MIVNTILDNVALTSSDVGDTFYPKTSLFREGVFQVEFASGTGSIDLQGKLHPDAPWELVQAFTGSDAVTVALMPLMRVSCPTSSSLVASAWLQHG